MREGKKRRATKYIHITTQKCPPCCVCTKKGAVSKARRRRPYLNSTPVSAPGKDRGAHLNSTPVSVPGKPLAGDKRCVGLALSRLRSWMRTYKV